MEHHDKESFYPSGFRQADLLAFVEHIKLHHSVELVGMKRVGINNFFRFFLAQKQMYLDRKFLIILVDLNNLIEREIFAFWRLTLKRIVDVIQQSSLPTSEKEQILHSFDVSIQTNDILVTFDGIREAVACMVQNHYYPVFFLNRFDRLKDAVNPEFFDNLVAIRDAGHFNMSFVFTSYRELENLSPRVFCSFASSGFSQVMYIKPAIYSDMSIISTPIEKQYSLKLDDNLRRQLFILAGGHVQYLRLSLLSLHEYLKSNQHKRIQNFFSTLIYDERISFQSEELWESLTPLEQELIRKIVSGTRLHVSDQVHLLYLVHTGFIAKEKKHWRVFSPLFVAYVAKIIQSKANGNSSEFTRQEHILFTYLKEHLNQVCERDHIINYVWPESSEWGASDWSLDKLIARVRMKLTTKQSSYQIVTARTLGYKLVENGTIPSFFKAKP